MLKDAPPNICVIRCIDPNNGKNFEKTLATRL